MKKNDARTLSALAAEVRHCALRLESLGRRPTRNPPTREDRKPWTTERVQAEIEGQQRRQAEALRRMTDLIERAASAAISQPQPSPQPLALSQSSALKPSQAPSLPAQFSRAE